MPIRPSCTRSRQMFTISARRFSDVWRMTLQSVTRGRRPRSADNPTPSCRLQPHPPFERSTASRPEKDPQGGGNPGRVRGGRTRQQRDAEVGELQAGQVGEEGGVEGGGQGRPPGPSERWAAPDEDVCLQPGPHGGGGTRGGLVSA